MAIVRTYDSVSLFKNDPGIGWVNLVGDGATCRAQLKCDDDRLVIILKQRALESKLYCTHLDTLCSIK